MRKLCLALCVTSLFAAAPATAQVSVGFSTPGLSVGVNVGAFPQLVQVPGYPVYYAPNLSANYFFYDGMFWLYDGDNWYTSAWYDGPWELVNPFAVPVYVLRVPVRYYRSPPPYFRSWAAYAPPRWGEHWGSGWEDQHRGWDRWDKRAAPAPAPLPVYQRQYGGSRYPRVQQQQVLQTQHYNYRPRETVAQHYYERVEASGATGRGQVAATPQDVQQRQADRQRRGDEAQRQGRPPDQAQRVEQAQREQPAAQQQQRPSGEPQRAQQQAQQRQAEQAQRSQQQQQRQAEQAQRAQQQAQQRQAEQAQRSQQQAQQQQRQAEQAQRAQQQAEQRSKQQDEQRAERERGGQGKGPDQQGG